MTAQPLRLVREDAGTLAGLIEAPFRADFIGPDPAGKYSLAPCVVVGCDRVRHSGGTTLCALHLRHHKEAGAPPLGPWVASAAALPSRSLGDPAERFAASRGVFVLAPLSGLIRHQVAYGLQVRGTPAAPQRARAFVVNELAQRLADHAIISLLDHDAKELVESLGLTKSRASAIGFVSTTQTAIRGALDLPGRRVLGLRRGGSGYFADYATIEPAWFGALVERWTNYRLAGERASPQYAGTQVAVLARFGAFLVEQGIDTPSHVSRQVLLDYREAVNRWRRPNGKKFGAVTIQRELSTVNNLLEDVRAHEWCVELPASARYFPGEYPRRPVPTPRFISEYVMQQLESPEALAQIDRDDMRVAILIIMTTGIRQIHALTLPLSCIEELPRSEGPSAWALRYVDTKTRKDMRVPLREDVAREVQAQQKRVRKQFGVAPEYLFPRTQGGGCVSYISPQTLHSAIAKWCKRLNLVDENAASTRVTAHQFRHTCGTRWINNNVPQHVVKSLLGHRSDAMVSVYAHLHDSTVRQEWENFQRVNIAGEPIAPPDGEVAEAEWMLEQVSRATQALPNGYCTLPIQQSCPHANACLTCDSFATGPEFLAVLEQQRDEHGVLLAAAEERGNARMAEINRMPFVNLNKIIEGLRRLPPREKL